MIERVKLSELRGVREGELASLSRLVVLIGPNGSGKSTVLEAIALAAARYPAAAVGMITHRRTHTWNGARWLLHGGREDSHPSVEAEWGKGLVVRRSIRWDRQLLVPELAKRLSDQGAPGPYSAFRTYRETPDLDPQRGADVDFSVTGIAADNTYSQIELEHDLELPPLRLVEPRVGEPLHDLFSRAVQAGQRDELLQSVRTVVPDLRGIEILTEGSEPRLFLTLPNGAVPASLGGDGIQALLRMAFELAIPPGGTVLLEEPEVHQHPRSLSCGVRSIVGAVRRGVQVILTTHSLELIDMLLDELQDDELDDPNLMTVRKLRIQEGMLLETAIAAREVETARNSLSEDLR